MQVETIYTFKNYVYNAHPVSSHKIKSRRFATSFPGSFIFLQEGVVTPSCGKTKDPGTRLEDLPNILGVFNKTIIPLARVGYEMIDSQLNVMRLVGYLLC